MKKLKAGESSPGIKSDAVAVDGGGTLCNIYWPTTGSVKDLVDNVEHYLQKVSSQSDIIYLLFDRYITGSIKRDTRNARVGCFQRTYQLTLDIELPTKEMCLLSSSTKENLIKIMSEELCKRLEKIQSNKHFIITTKSEVSTEVRKLFTLEYRIENGIKMFLLLFLYALLYQTGLFAMNCLF